MTSTWAPGGGSLGTALPPSDVPDFTVKVNGASLSQAALGDVRTVTVEEDLEALSMFSLELYNWDDEALRVSWSDSRQFALGGEVEIWLGFIDDLHRVMVGEIASLEPAFTSEQPPMLTVRGYDHRHRMLRGRRTRSFLQMKDSAIASQIARAAGLRAQARDTKVIHPYVLQSNQSDLEFLRQRAGLIGYEVFVRDKVLYFQPPGHGAKAAVRLSLGEEVTEFTPRLSALGQEDQVDVRAWDFKEKKEIVGRARTGQESAAMGRATGPAAAKRAFGRAAASVVDEPVRSKAAADQVALGRFDQQALAYVEGTATCDGRPQLRAGTVVDIDGAGKSFSGPYYVTSVTHTLSQDQGYQTSFNVRRNAS
ncbi:MAG TPA: contractile injection system protein, VgrG/Pvc8 family [Actinomycetes bacterium]|nr:contractile injection system protein, VgrG/Pvc8 family [Actinomycetes bacterium]